MPINRLRCQPRCRQLVVFLATCLATSFAATLLVTAPAEANPYMVVAAETSPNLCLPDPDCRASCIAKARRVYKACREAGHPVRECRLRARTLRRTCIESECRPDVTCEERCELHGKKLLRRCLENGGPLEQCQEDAKKATRACIERNCQGCACPEIYAPVCGVDGMTYSNACEARCAGVEIAHEGMCEPICKPLPCDVYCEYGHVLDPDGCPTCECNPPPGCRSDADCAEDQTCLQLCPARPCFEDDPNCGDCVGVCVPRVDPCVCPDVWDPVCGVDGVTYGNACEARCAGVEVKHEGECRTICPDVPLCDIYCPNGYVLGPDGCPRCECQPGDPVSWEPLSTLR